MLPTWSSINIIEAGKSNTDSQAMIIFPAAAQNLAHKIIVVTTHSLDNS